MKRLLSILCLLVPLLAMAAGSGYRLGDGSQVQVDPDSGRATLSRDGIHSPLWDGVHRLEDGSLLMINRGVAILPRPPEKTAEKPAEQLQKKAEAWIGAPIGGYSPCERLVRTACGQNDACRAAESCSMARQLLEMEGEERNASDNRYRMTYTSGQCIEVSSDVTLFPACKVQSSARK